MYDTMGELSEIVENCPQPFLELLENCNFGFHYMCIRDGQYIKTLMHKNISDLMDVIERCPLSMLEEIINNREQLVKGIKAQPTFLLIWESMVNTLGIPVEMAYELKNLTDHEKQQKELEKTTTEQGD